MITFTTMDMILAISLFVTVVPIVSACRDLESRLEDLTTKLDDIENRILMLEDPSDLNLES